MARFDHAHDLLDASEVSLAQIETLDRQSLASQRINTQLRIEIKHVLDDLRSALDYAAKELYDRFCTQGRGNLGGFPIFRQQQHFANSTNGMLPGLRRSRPDIYDKLESYQPYTCPDNEWLGKLNVLRGDSNHDDFSAQTRREERGTQLTDEQGRSVSWNEDVRYPSQGGIEFKERGKLRFGPGGSVEFGPNGAKPLGRTVDPKTQIPLTRPGDKVAPLVWVDFRFDAIDESVLPFLRVCVQKVRAIVKQLEQAL